MTAAERSHPATRKADFCQRAPGEGSYRRTVTTFASTHEDTIGSATVTFMSIAAALGTATIYPLQPAVAEVSASLGVTVAAMGVVLACGPVGYMVGLALLVPLVDRFSPRIVLALQFLALAAALVLTAVSGVVWLIGPAMLVTGACSSVGAGLSSVVGRSAPPSRRSTSLGIVTAGISAGILAGRILGGWLTDLVGWQNMLLVVAAACVVVAAVCLCALPAAEGSVTQGYLAALVSTPALFRRSRVLRSGALRGALWFFAFCAVWSGIAVALSEPPSSLSAEQIGLYGLAGISGILATRIAGRWTDRVGPRPVLRVGLAVAGASCVILAYGLSDVAVTLVALALFDAGLFAAQVANQTTILAMNPAAPAQSNGAYMLVYFIGGSLGTGFGTAAVAGIGWPACVAICGASIAVAGALTRSMGAGGTEEADRVVRSESDGPDSIEQSKQQSIPIPARRSFGGGDTR